MGVGESVLAAGGARRSTLPLLKWQQQLFNTWLDACMPLPSCSLLCSRAQKAFANGGEFHFGRQSQNVSQSKQIGFCQVQATCIPAAIQSASASVCYCPGWLLIPATLSASSFVDNISCTLSLLTLCLYCRRTHQYKQTTISCKANALHCSKVSCISSDSKSKRKIASVN